MKHCIYIRQNYKDFAAFLKRTELMMATAYPSLLAQEGDFDVQVLVSCAQHGNVIEWRTNGLFRAVTTFEFEGYDIQTRMDSDDIVFPGYVQEIQRWHNGTPRVVTFQIKKFVWSTGALYAYASPYHTEKCSMFTSLLCPREGDNIFSRKHGALWELGETIVSDKDLCRLVVHGNNIMTGVGKKDVLIPTDRGGNELLNGMG